MTRHCFLVERWGRLVVTLGAVVTTSACALLGARSDPGGPPLEVPEAPPRVVAEFPPEPLPPAIEDDAGVVERPETEPVDVATAPAEPDPRPPAPAATTPVPEPAATTSAPVPLQLTSEPDEALDTGAVQSRLAATDVVLRRIDRAELSSAGRAQHDMARRFLRQATTALRAGNVTFAHYLGEKAETLVRNLQTR